MAEDPGTTRGGELSHGYKAKTVNTTAKTTSMDAKTETNGYRPTTSQTKPVSRPTPPKPPTGAAGGSK